MREEWCPRQATERTDGDVHLFGISRKHVEEGKAGRTIFSKGRQQTGNCQGTIESLFIYSVCLIVIGAGLRIVNWMVLIFSVIVCEIYVWKKHHVVM